MVTNNNVSEATIYMLVAEQRMEGTNQEDVQIAQACATIAVAKLLLAIYEELHKG